MTKAKPKPKTTRRKASLADRSCEAVKALTPEHRPALWVRPMTIRAKATPLPDLSKDRPHQASTEHHTRCPICGHVVDELDLAEVMEHLEPDHQAPSKI